MKKCVFCKFKEIRKSSKTGLCYSCLLSLSNNKLKAIIEIYIKRKKLENIRLRKGHIKKLKEAIM